MYLTLDSQQGMKGCACFFAVLFTLHADEEKNQDELSLL